MVSSLINANPVVYEKKDRRVRGVPSDADEYAVEPIDQQEVFDILFGFDCGDIKDPEHPYSLEELKVITEDAIEVDDHHSYVRVTFTPTVEHCSMATIIGLCLRVKLIRSLPSRYKIFFPVYGVEFDFDGAKAEEVIRPPIRVTYVRRRQRKNSEGKIASQNLTIREEEPIAAKEISKEADVVAVDVELEQRMPRLLDHVEGMVSEDCGVFF